MGKCFVRELQKEKNIDEIWLIARRRERLEEMEAKGEGMLRAIPLDLQELSDIWKFQKLLEQEMPKIQYLVNGAGIGRMGMVSEIAPEAHAALLDINVRALTCMSRICLPYMGENSYMIQMCSGSAFLPQPEFASYAASKAYVLSFSRALRQEVKNRKISVTAVCPGPVNTEFFEAAGSKIKPSKQKFLTEPEAVVKKALKDAKAGKVLSVYGGSMKLVHLAGKIVPTEWILKGMEILNF